MQFKWENIGIKTRVEKNRLYFFDPIRKKYIQSTPEEEVRQWFIYELTHNYGYPATGIAVEKQIQYLQRKKRFDILIYKQGSPVMLIECKAPNVKITQASLNQIGRYNFVLKVPYLVITNGKQHVACQIDLGENNIDFLEAVPRFESLGV